MRTKNAPCYSLTPFRAFVTIVSTVGLCGVILVFTGCTTILPVFSFAHFQRAVKSSATISTNSAIVYGRFKRGPSALPGGHIGLRLHNVETRHEYLVGFRCTNSVYAVAIPPGRYTIAGYVGTGLAYDTFGKVSFPATPSFDCQPGSVTYLGDFKSDTRDIRDKSGQDLYELWGIFGFTNNYARTTQKFKANYSNFSTSITACATESVDAFQKDPKIYAKKIFKNEDYWSLSP